MQEDILGTQRAAFPIQYVLCTRCGKPVPSKHALLVPSDALSDERSEYEYLCQNCQAELASGEKDFSAAIE